MAGWMVDGLMCGWIMDRWLVDGWMDGWTGGYGWMHQCGWVNSWADA